MHVDEQADQLVHMTTQSAQFALQGTEVSSGGGAAQDAVRSSLGVEIVEVINTKQPKLWPHVVVFLKSHERFAQHSVRSPPHSPF